LVIEVASPELWAELRSRRPSYDDALETVPATAAVSGSMYGVDLRGELHLLLPMEGPPSAPPFPDIRGLRLRERQLGGLGRYLDLIAAACHQTMFSPLCAEVLKGIEAERRQPWDAVLATVRAWQTAWKSRPLSMDKTVQVGLYGELLTLEHIMIPALGPRAVHHWSGPERERHDFVGASLHIEVKTTRKNRHEHEISRSDQLSVPAGRRLVLTSLLLEESVTGDESLAEKVDAVTDLLRGDATAADAFQAKLVQIGWSEELRSTGELLRFHTAFDSLILPVEGSFPRLPDDFVVPAGIVALRYTVDLANLPAFSREEVLEAVQRGFPPMIVA
jgi:Putative  PD-(D/E)XK family member, (DUF4420)